MDYFGRVYKLEIGAGGNVRTFDGFPAGPSSTRAPAQIRFLVDQTPAAEHSYAEITLYGLSWASRQAVYREYEAVRLTAGYRERFGVIFNGEIKNVEIGREGPEAFVRLYCQSAAKQWPTAYINQSFGANTPALDIIRTVAATFGLPVEIVGDFSQLPRAIKGLTLSQGSKSALADLARSHGFTWFVENGRLVIWKHGATRPGNKSFKYALSSGLVGTPEITYRGVNATVLLDPLIRPGDLFEVEAETARLTTSSIYHQRLPATYGRGQQQVVSLKHEGDFYGDRWQTTLEGRRPDPKATG